MIRQGDRQILLMALVLLGATGVAVVRVPGAGTVNDAVGRALTPVQGALTGSSATIAKMVSDARDMERFRTDNERLTIENAQLTADNAKVMELIRENQALRSELDFARQRIDLDLAGASVTGKKVAEEPGNVRRTIKLDVGTSDGVMPWMPVANHVGMIGQTTHSAPYWSDVLLITDPASNVQARVARSRHTGIVSGGPGGDLVMRYIPQVTDDGEPPVREGDLVYSSGLSQRFPPMLLIGQVTSVRQSDEKTHQEAIVRPAVDFHTLELALVIRDWLPPTAGGGPDGSPPDGSP